MSLDAAQGTNRVQNVRFMPVSGVLVSRTRLSNQLCERTRDQISDTRYNAGQNFGEAPIAKSLNFAQLVPTPAVDHIKDGDNSCREFRRQKPVAPIFAS